MWRDYIVKLVILTFEQYSAITTYTTQFLELKKIMKKI